MAPGFLEGQYDRHDANGEAAQQSERMEPVGLIQWEKLDPGDVDRREKSGEGEDAKVGVREVDGKAEPDSGDNRESNRQPRGLTAAGSRR